MVTLYCGEIVKKIPVNPLGNYSQYFQKIINHQCTYTDDMSLYCLAMAEIKIIFDLPGIPVETNVIASVVYFVEITITNIIFRLFYL